MAHNICAHCGVTFIAAPSQRRKFCSRPCLYTFHKDHPPEALVAARAAHRAPWLKALNETPGRNRAIAQASRGKNRAAKLLKGGNNGRTYAKFYGRHEHRVVAEKALGRTLTSSEIVHHIDNNKRNNDISNLMLMTRADHARHHLQGAEPRGIFLS